MNGRVTSATGDPMRRLHPRIIDSDWLVMRGLSRAIHDAAPKVARTGTVIIDFGSGTMPYKPVFADLGAQYLGADFSPDADYSIDRVSGLMSAPDASADLVVSFQVLEHVRDLDAFFSETRRVLKIGGKLMLSTHGTWLYHAHPHDYRRWTREGLINEIETRGFDVTDCEAIVGPLAWTTVMRLTGFCFVLRKLPVLGPLVGFALALVMNARAWIEDAVTPRSITRDNGCIYLTVSDLRAG